jgi:tetratricopeptide (TPR) repeat protein
MSSASCVQRPASCVGGILAVLLLAGCSDPPRPLPMRDADRLSAAGAESYAQGEYSGAAVRFTAAIQSSRALDDQPAIARDLHNRGTALLAGGATAQARSDLSEALALALRLGWPPDRAATVRLGLGSACAELGQRPEAAEQFALAATAAKATGEDDLEARALASLAGVRIDLGDTGGAADPLLRACHIAEDPATISLARANRARLLLATGQLAEARADAETAIATARAAGVPGAVATALATLAAIIEAGAGGEIAAWRDAADAWRRAALVPCGRPQRSAAWFTAAARCARHAGDGSAATADDAEAARLGELR